MPASAMGPLSPEDAICVGKCFGALREPPPPPQASPVQAAEACTPLRTAVELWHAQLPAAVLVELRSIAQALVDSPLAVATACSGTDIALLALSEIVDHWQDLFELRPQVRHLFSCEKNKARTLPKCVVSVTVGEGPTS